MLDKARILAEKFDHLTDQLSAPEVLSDGSAMQPIAKERARLEPIAKTVREVETLERQIASARTSLNDPEMGELAEMEIAELEPRLAAKTAELTDALLPRDEDADR